MPIPINVDIKPITNIPNMNPIHDMYRKMKANEKAQVPTNSFKTSIYITSFSQKHRQKHRQSPLLQT